MQSSVSAQANFNKQSDGDDLPVSASAYDVTGYAATVAAGWSAGELWSGNEEILVYQRTWQSRNTYAMAIILTVRRRNDATRTLVGRAL